MSHLKKHASTILVAMVTAAVTASAPAIAHGVRHALFAHNAGKVDGLNAVDADAGKKKRKGKLVATEKSNGKFPKSVIPKVRDADKLDGMDSSDFLGSADKAADSDLLDGMDSSAFTYSAGEGLTLAGTTFSADFSQTQKRIAGTCASGEYMRAVDQAGTPTCSPDANTTYTAGPGLLLGGGQFSPDFAGNGSANKVARSDHHHATSYIDQVSHANGSPEAASLHIEGVVRTRSWLRSGAETGTTDGPFFCSAFNCYAGLVHRRIVSTTTTAGSVIARANPDFTPSALQRDGTAGGLQFAFDPTAAFQSLSCLGVTTSGTPVGAFIPQGTPTSPATVFTDAQSVIMVTCSFGDAHHPADVTTLTMHRSAAKWVGTMSSTFNQ